MPSGAQRRGDRRALVYRGPASAPGCPEAVAHLLRASRWGFDVRYVGPGERLRLRPESLTEATLYAQPGGGSLRRAWRTIRPDATTVRDYVRSGGRYVGFCLGAYLAGHTPGFGLLPGDAERYITSSGASVRTAKETLIDVHWGGALRPLYFQDGPFIALDPALGPARVLATYVNGLPAAVVAPCGHGTVGVVGPHPEAGLDWFTDAGLTPPLPLGTDLAQELVDEVMAP